MKRVKIRELEDVFTIVNFLSLGDIQELDPPIHEKYVQLFNKLGEKILKEYTPERFDRLPEKKVLSNSITNAYYLFRDYHNIIFPNIPILGYIPGLEEAIANYKPTKFEFSDPIR